MRVRELASHTNYSTQSVGAGFSSSQICLVNAEHAELCAQPTWSKTAGLVLTAVYSVCLFGDGKTVVA